MAQRVGSFELLKSIGTGGMAEVFSAVHQPSRQLVALKVLRETTDPALLAAFRREVRAVAALDHPHIARIHDQGVTGPGEAFPPGTPWLAMELARLGTLRDRRGTLPWPALRQTLLQVLDALGHAHARGVIHRDIKPDNVLMGEHGPLLADFGLAHRLATSTSTSGPAGGSPAYMAPEQFRRSEAEMGPWTDLYGVGCLAWALATGKPPFTGIEAVDGFRNAHLFREPPPFEPRRSVPAGFEAWLRGLLAKAPAARPRLAADAAHALQELDDSPAGDTTSGSLPSLPPWNTGGSETWHDLPLGTTPLPAPERTPTDLSWAVPPMPADWRRADPPERERIPGVGLGLLSIREVGLVGRERERDQLWAALRAVRQSGRPRAVILGGAPGIGTDRLALWLVRRAHATGSARILFTTHSPVAPPGAGLGWAVANLLRSSPLPFETAADRVLRAPELAELTDPVDRSAVANLVDRLHQGRPASRGDIDGAIVPVLSAMSQDRPVIFWLSRAEHSTTSLAFVSRLLDRDGPPVLALLSVRDDAVEERTTEMAQLQSLAEREDVDRIALGPLPPIDRPALVRSLLPLESTLARTIEERTAGHPGFVSELIRSLVHRDQLVPTDAGYAPRGPLELPADLTEAWSRRLEGVLSEVPPDARDALHVAALLWSDLVDATWAVICSECGVADPDEAIEPLLVHGLASRLPDGDGWSFAAGLRDALLERPVDDLPRLHRICASVARKRDGGAETEAHHLLQAGDHEAALQPLLRAIHERVTLGHYDAATRLLDRPELAALPPDHPASLRAAILRSAVFRYRGLVDEAEAALDGLESQVADQPTQAAALFVARGALAYQRSRLWEAVEHLRDAEDRFLALDDPDGKGLASCRVHLADCLMRLGRLDEAREALEHALAGFRDRSYRPGAANAMLALGGLALRTGELDQAERWLGRAAGAFTELGVRFGLAETHNRMGELARQQGQLDQAERLYRLAAEGFEAIGSADALIPQLNQGLIRLRQERWQDAIEVLEASSAAARAQGRDLGEVGRILLLPCYAALGRWNDFDEGLREARAFLGRTGMVHLDLGEQAFRAARLCADAGHEERSRKSAKVALDQFRRLERTDEAAEVKAFLDGGPRAFDIRQLP